MRVLLRLKLPKPEAPTLPLKVGTRVSFKIRCGTGRVREGVITGTMPDSTGLKYVVECDGEYFAFRTWYINDRNAEITVLGGE